MKSAREDHEAWKAAGQPPARGPARPCPELHDPAAWRATSPRSWARTCAACATSAACRSSGSRRSRACLARCSARSSSARARPRSTSSGRSPRALGVPFSALITARGERRAPRAPLRAGEAPARATTAPSARGRSSRSTSRAGSSSTSCASRPGGVERADAHNPGTTENLVVAKGEVEIEVAGRKESLVAGDAIVFEADVAARLPQPVRRRIGDVPRDDVRGHRRVAAAPTLSAPRGGDAAFVGRRRRRTRR